MFDLNNLPTLINICAEKDAHPWEYVNSHVEDWQRYPHLFVLGAVLDKQMPAHKIWEIPFRVADLVGGLEFENFLNHDEEFYIRIFVENKLHRHPTTAAKEFYLAIQRIHYVYGDNAAAIWSDTSSAEVIEARMRSFKGIGVKISALVPLILKRDLGLPISQPAATNIAPDIHIKRVMYRLGLLDIDEPESFQDINPELVQRVAREINPEYPGVFDSLFWELGNSKICKNNNTLHDCERCPLHNICSKVGVKD